MKAVTQNVDDTEGRPAGQLKGRLLILLRRLKGLSVREYKVCLPSSSVEWHSPRVQLLIFFFRVACQVWTSAARFYNFVGEHQEAFDSRRSAYQLVKAQLHWEQRPEAAKHVVLVLEDMVTGVTKDHEVLYISPS